MATESPPPPKATTENPSNSAAESAQQTSESQQDAQPEAAKPISSPSVFVNSEPMREEQVQNAVKFLSHPKVRGSPVIYRRSFLEKKGLTKEEIDEAFRLVPDLAPSAQATSTNQDGPAKSPANIQSQALQPQPTGAAPTAVISPSSTSMMSQFHWYHAVVAVGLLAASGVGTAVFIKKTVVPRFKSWIQKVVLEEDDDNAEKTNAKPSLADGAAAAAAAKAAAAAAADVAKASQEMLTSKNEERRYFEEFMNVLAVHLQEMKSMSNSIRKLEVQTNISGKTTLVNQDHRVSVTGVKQPYWNGKADLDVRSVSSSSPGAPGGPSVAPHPKSYMDIMGMVQRGEKPSNIRDINDLPPNPNQQPSNPRLAPRAKPWEVGQSQNASSQVLKSQVSGEGLSARVQGNGLNHQVDDDSSIPWWQRKNVRITEVENEDETNAWPYSVRNNEPPVQRTWVPPQPPPVVMPEAAEAIQRPKPSVQKEEVTGDQSVSQPSDVTDELQTITTISENGGAKLIKGDGPVLNSSEIQEEQELIQG